jgi:Domain of unknown function (DUF4338)
MRRRCGGGCRRAEGESLRSIAHSGTLARVDESLTYRGRRITAADLTGLRDLLAAQSGLSRRALSFAVCDAWHWRQPNGTPCDAICRGLLLWLHRGGHLVLPPARWGTRKPWRPRTSAPPVLIDTTPITGALRALRPLAIRQVRRTPDEGLCNSLLAQYHYLGYQQPVGAHLKYLVCAADRPVACVTWASAPRHLGPRDRFIGWSPDTRRRNLRFLAYNARFLILPWVMVPHLASHVLGQMAARLSADWQQVYGHPIYFLETFVDPARFRGTCYRAANWIALGLTTGRGHNAPTQARTQPVKEVLGYPLTPDFRQRLAQG